MMVQQYSGNKNLIHNRWNKGEVEFSLMNVKCRKY